ADQLSAVVNDFRSNEYIKRMPVHDPVVGCCISPVIIIYVLIVLREGVRTVLYMSAGPVDAPGAFKILEIGYNEIGAEISSYFQVIYRSQLQIDISEQRIILKVAVSMRGQSNRVKSVPKHIGRSSIEVERSRPVNKFPGIRPAFEPDGRGWG